MFSFFFISEITEKAIELAEQVDVGRKAIVAVAGAAGHGLPGEHVKVEPGEDGGLPNVEPVKQDDSEKPPEKRQKVIFDIFDDCTTDDVQILSVCDLVHDEVKRYSTAHKPLRDINILECQCWGLPQSGTTH